MHREVLWVIGPAMGHVSRALVVAEALRATHGIESRFIGTDIKGCHRTVIDNRFPYIDTETDRKEHLSFPSHILRALDRHASQAICFDCSPIPWLISLPDIEIPTAYLTNEFLVSGQDPTYQDLEWKQHGVQWNRIRGNLGLPAIGNAREIYTRCNVVLLADPPAIASPNVERPLNVVTVGACAWSPRQSLPDVVKDLNDLLVIGSGSTGTPVAPRTVEKLRAMCGAKHVVAVRHGGISIDGTLFDSPPVDLSRIYARAIAAITQGGAGSTYLALSCGIPAIINPTHINHLLLGKSVERAGLGWVIDRNRAEPFHGFDLGKASRNARSNPFPIEGGAAQAASRLSKLIQ